MEAQKGLEKALKGLNYQISKIFISVSIFIFTALLNRTEKTD